MADNLFDLASKITADTSAHDRALTESQKKVLALAAEHQALDRKSTAAFKNVGQAAQRLTSHLGGTSHAASELHREFVRTSLSGEGLHIQFVDLISSAGLLENPLILIAAGMIGTTVAAVGLGTALFELAKTSAAYGEEIYKAQAKTGLTAEMLSSLKVISVETETSFEGLTTTAARLQVNISKGITEPAGEAGRALRFLGLNNEEFKKSSPDEQLVRTAKALEGVTNQADKNRSAQALVSRGWIQSADALKDIAERSEEARKKADAFGLTLGQDAVERAREFQVAMTDSMLIVEGFGLKVGGWLVPQVTGALNDINYALTGNQGAWASWADFIGEIMARVVNEVRVQASIVAASVRTLPGAIAAGYATGSVGTGFQVELDAMVNAGRAARFEFLKSMVTSGVGDASKGSMPTFPKGGGGGRGGDPAVAEKRLADLRLKAVLDGLKAEDEANKRSLDRRWETFDQYAGRYNATELRRHSAVIEGLKEEMDAAEKIRKPQERLIAIQQIKNKQAEEENTHTKNSNKVLDDRAKLLDQLHDFMDQQIRDIGYARSNTDQYDRAVAELEVQLRKAGVTEIDYALSIARTNAQTQRAIDLVKMLTRERRAIAERPRFAEDKNLAHSVGIELDETNATRQRRATQLPDWLYKILPGGDVDEKLHQLAGDITNTLDQAIRDGFDKGIKEGFRSMALGFLHMLEQMAEQWLASSIFKMLQGAFSPSGGTTTGGQVTSGGNWFLKALQVALPFIGSVFGAGLGSAGGGGAAAHGPIHEIGHIGGYASGLDYVPYDNFPAMLHKGERVMTAQENKRTVGGDLHVHFHVDSVAGAGSRETQRQVAEKVRRLQLYAALQG
jgi:hypothetical protein